MSIVHTTMPVTAADGVTSALSVWLPPSPKTVMLFHAGLGVAAGYYRPFAEALAAKGHAVAVMDPRGVGSSSVRPSRGVDFGYHELVALEIPAAWAVLRERFDGVPAVMGGHSLGAQLTVLAGPVLPPWVSGVVLVAAGSLFHRNWSGLARWRVLVAGSVFPTLGRVFGRFPGKAVGFGGWEARTLMRDWGHCARTGRYRLHGSDRDWEAEASTQTRPVLTITMATDDWAPPVAMRHLVDKMPRAPVDRHHVQLDDGRGMAHFRWARDPERVVAVVDPWLHRLEDYSQTGAG
ncbi:MAG: alpha/beta fold hydrolase [Deltaproteobacteria bacterium]|nr:alpha/beta fold hydrolase [Deltaproteobacteria bacterium]